MNGDNQAQQEQHRLAERIAHVETAVEYLGKEQSDMRDEMRERFSHVDAQILKIRTTDLRILLGICTTMALGILGLVIKVFGQL